MPLLNPRVLAALLLVTGCEQESTPPATETDSRAEAPRTKASDAEVRAAALAPYSAMKLAAAQFARDNFQGYEPSFETDDSTGEELLHYAVEDCQEPFENAELAENVETKTLELERLARRIAKHEFQLSQVYDRRVFEEPLRVYEQRVLKLIDIAPPRPRENDSYDTDEQGKYLNARVQAWVDHEELGWDALRELTKDMEKRRLRFQPSAAAIRLGGGCGAGEMPYLVQTDPKGGRVWLATKFSFDLCGARQLDQWSVEKCRWTEVDPNQEVYLSGRYVYQSRWPNGKKGRGIRVFSGFYNADGQTPSVVKIRAP